MLSISHQTIWIMIIRRILKNLMFLTEDIEQLIKVSQGRK